ncbi:glycogen/starch synthase [Porphyromonas somerae]|uniref:glycogen/starch synthase n=1 Tax=Porphyromonas somerae TaxID=322095 RepID=UPI002A911DD5|nr:glycogen/starch synthase [Porphyromonas somerae]MDY5815759.1 glycogen/starch synthase [Porphyromonas somerae]
MSTNEHKLSATPTLPTLIMETSWEVCNKVGGIYTVLSTRVATMIEKHGRESLLFIGPKLETPQRDFIPSRKKSDLELADKLSAETGIKVHLGSWDVVGKPRVALVAYQSLASQKDGLYYEMWQEYGIRGEIGYGDYDDSCLFSLAVAKVMKAYIMLFPSDYPLAIFNEWTTGMGLLALRKWAPQIYTLFITHATSVGRSIASNGKPLYSQLPNYNGNQMAEELGVMCKHQVERSAAHVADVFATVSEVTALEAAQLIGREPMVLPNGWEEGVIPSGYQLRKLREGGRKAICHLAETLYGTKLGGEPFIVATSGRCEYRNKGLDVFIDALRRLHNMDLSRDIVALILVPSWVKAPRPELQAALASDKATTLAMQMPYVTHELNDGLGNQILAHLHSLAENWGQNIYPIFIPDYLDGADEVLNITYYDLLPAVDLTVFASYYEPWGYTPLESVAFGVPTLTTDKAGFGMWAMETNTKNCLRYGAKALEREDDGFESLAESIAQKIARFYSFPKEMVTQSKQRAKKLAQKASWSYFYAQYLEAYSEAINRNPSKEN